MNDDIQVQNDEEDVSEKPGLSQRLRALRRERGLTQAEFAAQIGVTRSSVANWETGTRTPSCGCVEQISKFFVVSSDYLYGTSDYRYAVKMGDYFEMDLSRLNSAGMAYLYETYKLLTESEKYKN